ncbi:hypothetical protein ONE63_005336 [Megalurothrips usitatus]|uniref:CCDC92/74 N-terminal domain-containing protein n=1 Tax=Megalurothrips usitatus TaxID=439358 RepID=A0AAV7Y2D8_9NEOP|nr:hypothetical protein ONE63_005336 [Megalurothrips usitatus]
MASKVLVKIPVNFGTQVGKCTTADIISASVSGTSARAVIAADSSVSTAGSPSDPFVSVNYDPIVRAAQLEQNIKFLKEQHHLMLTSLHHEVEALRQRNRDLQFQLVFSKGSLALVKSTPSSPEDDSKPQMASSPKQVNVTSLQVEILERDVAELRSSLNEVRVRNSSLENIIEEQKQQLENATKPTASDNVPQSNSIPDPDLVFKLEETEKMIRRLRRENDEQRRELAMIKANQNKEQVAAASTAQRLSSQWSQQHHQHQEQQTRDHREQREQSHDHPEHHEEAASTGSRFPPLNNNQKFWHNNGGSQRGRWNHSWDSSRGAGGSRMLNQSLPSLPNLPMGSHSASNPSNSNPSSAPFTLLSHGGGSGGGRRMRGNYRGDRSGAGRGGNSNGNGSGQSGGRGHWDQNREHRGRDRNRDQHGFHE